MLLRLWRLQLFGRLLFTQRMLRCRAGRDGAPSESLMYCSQADLKQLKQLEKPLRAGAAGAVAGCALFC